MFILAGLADRLQLDDTGDLARVCRTCRVLNYMSLPQLYRHLTLTSYDKIRYRGEEPEGVGSASPFSMGLNAVITRPYATLVRSLTLRGEWREHELEEHARVGRVPDSSMMLNIAVRAAVDRMTDLESFSWDLNTKMLETVYLGLAQLPRLTSLSVRFPSSRHPRPTIVVPPMPHLRSLKLTDIDPLCYPDDISTLLWKCKKLQELYMHWSPRMRNEQEPSVMLHDYFRKCIAAREPLGVKKIGLQNLYALHSEEFNLAFDPKTVEEVTILNNTGSDGTNFMNTFVDRSWPTVPPNERLRIKCMRQDAPSKRHAEFLANFTGLEKLYFVNTPRDPSDMVNFPRRSSTSSDAVTPPLLDAHPSSQTAANSPVASSPASSTNLQLNIRDNYLNAIVMSHASTLRHLLLSSRWPLSASTIVRLVHASPQLEQLAFATELSSMDTLGIVIPFLRKLSALRLLIPTGNVSSPTVGGGGGGGGARLPRLPSDAVEWDPLASARSLADIVEMNDHFLAEKMSVSLADKGVFGNLKIIGMGRKAWELQDFYTVPEENSRLTNPGFLEACYPSTTVEPGTPHFENAESNPGLGISSSSPSRSVTHTHTHTHTNNHPHHKPRQPSSVLGKHPRDEEPWESIEPSKNRQPSSHEEPHENGTNGTNGAGTDSCVPVYLGSDGLRWRRRIRRVGWETLQHWEVWALDKEEL